MLQDSDPNAEAGPDGADMEGADLREVHMRSTPPSPASSISLDGDTCPPSSDFEGDGDHPPEPTLKRKHCNDPDMGGKPRYRVEKRKRIGELEIGTDDEESCEERGESRSATASRKLKESLKSGQFVIDKRKRVVFEEKCTRMSNGVRFRYGEKWEVLHQKCGKWSTMTEPYNTTRFKTHLNTCKSNGAKGHNGCIVDFFHPQANSAGIGALAKSARRPNVTVRRQVVIGGRTRVRPHLETPPVIAEFLPCLGLRENHSNQIPKYISRALTEGAGSRSESHIATKLFGDGTRYSELGDKGKQLVQAAQVHSRAWVINRELQAIYSTSCRKVVIATAMESTCSECLGVLRMEVFKKALSVEPAPLASRKYIPHRWRTAATDLAISIADINGLSGLLEAVSPLPPTFPCTPVDNLPDKSVRTLTNPNGSDLFRMSSQANTRTRSCCWDLLLPRTRTSGARNAKSASRISITRRSFYSSQVHFQSLLQRATVYWQRNYNFQQSVTTSECHYWYHSTPV